MEAIWTLGSKDAAQYSPLRQDTEADVVVIGAGITGLMTALRLAEAGQRVIVLEALTVGAGGTGGATGNLYSTLASGHAPLQRKWGEEVAGDVAKARSEAIDHIEALIGRFAIDCDFHRQPAYRVMADNDDKTSLDLNDEYDALVGAGLDVRIADDPGLPFETQGLKIHGQAQFNPLQFTQGLGRAACERGVVIHEHSPVREVNAKESVVLTDTARVSAPHIVHATHTPKGINLLQGGMLVFREYAVSARLKSGRYPEGIIWVLDPFHSLRSYRHAGERHLMVIGEKHKTGEHRGDYYQLLRDYLNAHFDVEAFTFQWSAQQYSSPDGLPYIGRMHGHDNLYMATGFAADGLVWGTLAGMLIADQIMGRANPWQARFDSRRLTLGKSAAQYAKENATVTKHMVKDYLGTEKLKEFDEVRAGQARVASVDGEKLAIHRTAAGELKVLSAVCPHMKCIVHWNAAESTWDCPCHGSRFDHGGGVIEGPAYQPLERRDRPD
ncbi:FAD-dependent oxidoreductase [Billgrantia endophytica]|uniref:FAD-dependent oxidoreductase n=1 Tax=Billgrantia endophytica TaxID=2033802 RepID=A0A2N7UBT8_9GAMM|nr:FAD-dependent oxidoreductase [Halomonas endophytica]PMR77906.1 FAD-dependent oxidoreductase [Halomonas endophytica]